MTRLLAIALSAVLLGTWPAAARAQQPAATETARTNRADVAFMQGMIGHHAQALEMSALVAGRSANKQLPLLAERITVSQEDEIAIMRQWLTERGEAAPAITASGDAHSMHAQHAGHDMPGMLSPAQMDSLKTARGSAFDRLFLQYMIQHHEGALVMVAQLLASPAAARDPMIFQFASDVDTDQRAEIRRMRALLATLR
jgi:uncharacterized protein (DUF305 family)